MWVIFVGRSSLQIKIIHVRLLLANVHQTLFICGKNRLYTMPDLLDLFENVTSSGILIV